GSTMAYTTRKSLLARVRQGDEISWDDFYTEYEKLILCCGSDYGLSQNEKEELVQNVMCEIFQRDMLKNFDSEESYKDYFFTHDQTKGRFRNYLRQVVKYQAYKIMRSRKNDIRIDDDDNHIQISSPEDDWDNIWEFEWERHVLNMALVELRGRVQPDTFVAFEMYALQNRPVQEVAEFLNISVSSVYTAKSRCISVLKEAIKELEDV
ncbi:MAG: sigma-70 family RNA polymerase sigma factor, partial [Lentisphaeria bacterium]|nr:sigma-70 family RNA polymerase sigma factor [Lentisphaeria bacterium]